MMTMTVAERSIWLWGPQIDDGSTESRFSAALEDVVIVFYWVPAQSTSLVVKVIDPDYVFFLWLVIIYLYNICVFIVFLLMLYVSYKLVWICPSLRRQICCHFSHICCNRNFLLVPVVSFCVLSARSPSWFFFLVCEIELSCQGP